jgi:choline dehydrogenase-like flavoprotein
MQTLDLNHLADNTLIQADVCIVGTGPAGLSIANELARTNIDVVLLESGGAFEEPDTQALYDIETAPPRLTSQAALRMRILGGSSHIWTGRCAPFHDLDLEERSWIPHSGWPFSRADLEQWLAPAGALLGLGPNCYDDRLLWPHFESERPSPPLDADLIEPMFWQFSKSPNNLRQSVDFGRDHLRRNAANLRLVLHANVTHINTDHDQRRFDSVEVRTLSGNRACVRARALVLCCGGVENARLLLASNRSNPKGIGNKHDAVGRFLMDHTDSVVGHFDPANASAVRSRFGHYWWDNDKGRHVFLHGLALSRKVQEREQLLNCHAYVDAFDPSPDDPWSAVERTKSALRSRRMQEGLGQDARTIVSHSGELLHGLYRRRFAHRPQLEHLTRIELHCILEQLPDPESRVTLSEDKADALGMPLSKVDWKISDAERHTAQRMTQLICQEFERLDLPRPHLSPWLDNYTAWTNHAVEKAHPTGTTRMADNPQEGVVDRNCQVHGLDGLFVCGSSVFPTSGAANPTLMIVAMSLRLAACLKSRYAA